MPRTPTRTQSAPKRPYEQLIFSPRTFDLKEFESLGRAAKDAGFTHLYISGLRDRSDYRGDDADSPWCEWSVVLPSIFKHVTPPGLEDAFGRDFVRRQMDWMKRKHAICAKLGMRAAYYGCEPHWLSERVYKQHPEWRGARCDNSLRTTGMFFAPNVDHPEVREAYRRGVQLIAKQCPLIDTYYLATNDSGAGFIWSQKLYVPTSGPTGFEGRDMGTRVAEFLDLLRQGAMDGGSRDPRMYTDLWFSPEEKHLVTRSMHRGIGLSATLNSKDPELVRECSLVGAGGWSVVGGVNMEPMFKSFASPLAMIGAAASLRSGRVARHHAGGATLDYFDALKLAMEKPVPRTATERVATLRHMAAGLYAEDVADTVVDAWETIERANIIAGVANADVFSGVMLRWLTRPLVAHQELLTEAEKSYWIKHIYQSKASHAEAWLDYTNVAGQTFPTYWEDASFVAIGVDQIEGTLHEAAMQLKAASEKTASRSAAKRLLVEHYRVLALRCCYKTVRHVVHVASLIRQRDADAAKLAARGEVMTTTRPERPDLPHGNMGSAGLFFMHRALRWELDNTHDLIKILKVCPEPIFQTAPDEAREGTLLLGPGLVAKLEKKARIMIRHWRDAEIGWYRPTLGG